MWIPQRMANPGARRDHRMQFRRQGCECRRCGKPAPARALEDSELLHTGKYRFRFLQTPHVPHCWEASLLFEETQGTLFCSDLFHAQVMKELLA